jgi:hypothetical protein
MVNFYQSTLALAGVIQSFPNSHAQTIYLKNNSNFTFQYFALSNNPQYVLNNNLKKSVFRF